MTGAPSMMFCCDPGLVSGVAILTHSELLEPVVKMVGSMECEMSYVGEAAEHFLTTYGPREAEMVCERFTITVKTAKNSQAPWSLEVIGMLRWLIWRHWQVDPEDALILQQPGDAKKMVDNTMLRKVGLWHGGGAGHANDALRHGVYRYARLGVRSILI